MKANASNETSAIQETRTSSTSSFEHKNEFKNQKGDTKLDNNDKDNEKILKKNLQELFDEAQDEYKSTEQTERRKRTHTQMLAQ